MSDALLAKIVIDIKRESNGQVFEAVPLQLIQSIHPINRKSALEKVDQRIRDLMRCEKELIDLKHISNDLLIRLMPSVSPIQAIRYGDGYIAFEGNGRLAALQHVCIPFSKKNMTSITLDVEIFALPPETLIFANIKKLQMMYTDK